mmetsp:Transcript_4124/g.9159  ORF Transcript_4124/g.9159 Transcript_4124/m.9159 type:complete len:131 (-) Transcript_4124:142-534(-)
MGALISKGPKDPTKVKLSSNLMKKIDEVFARMDKDGSKEVDTAEAANMFTKGFGAIATKKFFDDIDKDGDKNIQYDEFVSYFKRVMATGAYSDKDVIGELDNLLTTGEVCGFQTVDEPGSTKKMDPKKAM